MIEDILKYRGKYFQGHESAFTLLTMHTNLIKQSQENKLDPFPYKTVKVIGG